jgi:hypothetical protein
MSVPDEVSTIAESWELVRASVLPELAQIVMITDWLSGSRPGRCS